MPNTFSIISALSAKDKAMLEIAGSAKIREYWTSSNSAPDATKWQVVKDAGAICSESYDNAISASVLKLKAGNVGGLDGYCDTNNLITFGIGTYGITSFRFKTRIKITDLTGEFGFGFLSNIMNGTANNYNSANRPVACIYGDNDVINANSGDMTAKETTVISAYFTDDTYNDIEIIWTATSVRFIIDSVVRATHVTRVNTTYMAMAGFAARHSNGIPAEMFPQFCEVWAQ